MGTTAQKLQAIANSKAAIKSAIEAKGVSDVGDVLADYFQHTRQRLLQFLRVVQAETQDTKSQDKGH